MSDIELTPILLLALGAFFKFLDFIGNKVFDIIKNRQKSSKIKKSTLSTILKKLEEIENEEKEIKEKENQRLLANNTAILDNQDHSNDIIQEIVDITSVERFVIFNTHNGNGQPNYFKPYKVSHIQFDTLYKNSKDIKRYEDLHVDNVYTKMLLDIQKNPENKVCLKVCEMKDGLLKTIYTKEKIKYSEIYFICSTPTGIIYTSLATTEDIDSFKKHEYEINLAISKLKAIFIGEKDRVLKDELQHKYNMNKLQELYLEKQKLKDQLTDNAS